MIDLVAVHTPLATATKLTVQCDTVCSADELATYAEVSQHRAATNDSTTLNSVGLLSVPGHDGAEWRFDISGMETVIKCPDQKVQWHALLCIVEQCCRGSLRCMIIATLIDA